MTGPPRVLPPFPYTPLSRFYLAYPIRRLSARGEPLAEKIHAHWKRASTPTRYAEPTSLTPASRASVIRYFPIATRNPATGRQRSEEHTSELQSRLHLVCRLL